MTDLSPAAQAVLNAVDEVPRVLNCTQDHPLFAAAALRAAADHVGQLPVDLSTDWKNGFSEGVCLVHRELLAIADELEDAQ